MKKILIFIALSCALNANAQNYYINFTGTGASTSVSSVKVENLTAVTSLIVNTGYRLSLTFPTGVNSIENKQSSELKIYPNPTTGNSFFQVYPPSKGNATISVLDLNGKSVYQIQRNLERDLQEFCISGLNSGFYVVSVKGSTYQYSGKLVSNAKASGKISIEQTSNNMPVIEKSSKTNSKGSLNTNTSQPVIDMAYTDGDRLKFTGISGIYSTVVMDIPTATKTINFDFVDCTDGSGNSYPVVQIGTQLWMAENIRTIKYTSGSDITLASTDEEWGAFTATSKGYCYYDFIPANGPVYGALYTWAGAMDGAASTTSAPSGKQGVCPVGWHVPSIAEWIVLTTTLDPLPGAKLKETGFTHWWSSGGVEGTNESGFSARGGGFRQNSTFGFANQTLEGYWWSTTDGLTIGTISSIGMYNNTSGASSIEIPKGKGLSVRCLKD